MKQTSFYLLICLTALCSTACKQIDKSSETSAQRDTIRIKGSDTEFAMVQDLASTYMSEHPEVIILVQGGGSNKGITALLNKESDICNSSREIKPEEIAAALKNNVRLVPIMFATDALAIIANYKIGVDSLSTHQISQLFEGDIKNWKELKGPDQPIVVYGRDKSSGTRDYFREKFLDERSDPSIHELPTNLDVLNSVIEHEGAIGYVSAGFLLDSTGKPNGKIWAAPVYIENHPAVSPYEIAAVKKGDYIITRPLYQYVNGVPNKLIQDFMLFELTKKGQDIIMKHGFFPINDYQTQINRLKGLILE